MKKLFKKAIVLTTALAVLGASMTGCGKKDKYNTLADIQKKGELVMVTDAAWAPFEYIADGETPVGSDIDLAQNIADALGVKLKIINASFDSIPSYIENGQADIAVAAITITDERKEEMDFSVPYTTATQYIIVPEGDSTTKTINDLAGKKVGVHLGTTGDFLIADEISIDKGVLKDKGTSEVQYKNLQEGCLALQNGDIDAVVVDTLAAKNFVAVNKGLKCFEAVYADGSSTTEQYGIAVAKGNTDLLNKINEIVQPLVDDGTIEGYIEKHKQLAANLDENASSDAKTEDSSSSK